MTSLVSWDNVGVEIMFFTTRSVEEKKFILMYRKEGATF